LRRRDCRPFKSAVRQTRRQRRTDVLLRKLPLKRKLRLLRLLRPLRPPRPPKLKPLRPRLPRRHRKPRSPKLRNPRLPRSPLTRPMEIRSSLHEHVSLVSTVNLVNPVSLASLASHTSRGPPSLPAGDLPVPTSEVPVVELEAVVAGVAMARPAVPETKTDLLVPTDLLLRHPLVLEPMPSLPPLLLMMTAGQQ
jgi:hypothetical protein